MRDRIENACGRCSRDPGEITLVAVSKGHSAESVRAVADLGVTDFGENYLAELAEKAPQVPANWHFQGALQRRKIKDILLHVSSILSVSRPEELREIDKRAVETVECCLQVNIANEETKGGVDPADLNDLIDIAASLSKIKILGLMAIPPKPSVGEDPSYWFGKMANLNKEHGFSRLSLGMSDDFEDAIVAGSTMIRVGTALFGPRKYPPKKQD